MLVALLLLIKKVLGPNLSTWSFHVLTLCMCVCSLETPASSLPSQISTAVSKNIEEHQNSLDCYSVYLTFFYRSE